MSNKILFCATVDYHFSAFHLPMLEWFKEHNWEVHIAAKGEMDIPFADKKFNIPIERSPFRLQNREAYRQLKTIINDHDYRIIHCHTPLGGVIGRLAARRARKFGAKVIYTAHGFHFCKGAPLLNWLLYYPIERSLAHLTDCLITINDEDYSFSTSRKFKASHIEHVHGVGINTERYRPASPEERLGLRQRSGYELDEILMFYAAEFNANKNQQLIINALALIKERVPNVKLLLAGNGTLQKECRSLAVKLGVEHMIDFLGYRNDIDQLLPMCDIAVSSSLREGLPVNIMEAMACGLPIIATRNRGHHELVMNYSNGFLINPADADEFADRILQLIVSPELRQRMGSESLKRVRKYELQQVRLELSSIYSEYMAGEGNGTQDQYHSAYI